MIENWSYDDGEPHYMSAINKWSDRRKPVWRCRLFLRYDCERIKEWLKSNTKTSEIFFRFNNGYPYYEITIEDAEEAVAFYITWRE